MADAPEALEFHEAVTGRPGSMGTTVSRDEDPSVLAGAASYVGDVRRHGMLDAAFLRSPVAHGTIREIDAATAATMPGGDRRIHRRRPG